MQQNWKEKTVWARFSSRKPRQSPACSGHGGTGAGAHADQGRRSPESRGCLSGNLLGLLTLSRADRNETKKLKQNPKTKQS